MIRQISLAMACGRGWGAPSPTPRTRREDIRGPKSGSFRSRVQGQHTRPAHRAGHWPVAVLWRPHVSTRPPVGRALRVLWPAHRAGPAVRSASESPRPLWGHGLSDTSLSAPIPGARQPAVRREAEAPPEPMQLASSTSVGAKCAPSARTCAPSCTRQGSRRLPPSSRPAASSAAAQRRTSLLVRREQGRCRVRMHAAPSTFTVYSCRT